MAGAQRPRRPALMHAGKHPDYLQKVLTARVYDVAVETTLELAPHLSARLGNDVWLKREDNQPVFSFKLRGAYNKMAQLGAASSSAASSARRPATMRREWRSRPASSAAWRPS